MPITDPAQAISQINRLLSAFPPISSTDATETLRRYVEAIEDHELVDLENAVDRFIKAGVPGFDGRFAPTPPMLAGQCQRSQRERMEEWAKAEHRRRALMAPKESDWTDPAPEVRARGKAILDMLVADLGADMRTEEAARDAARQAFGRRVNERFEPDLSPEATAKRLGIGGTRYTVGDPDAEDGDMGGSRRVG